MQSIFLVCESKEKNELFYYFFDFFMPKDHIRYLKRQNYLVLCYF